MNGQMASRIFWGIALLAAGGVLLLRQAGVIEFDLSYIFATYWPVILIFLGLQNMLLVKSHGGGAGWWGIFMVLLGGFFLGRNLGVVDMSLGAVIQYGWPVILIVIGLTRIAEYVMAKDPDKDKKEGN